MTIGTSAEGAKARFGSEAYRRLRANGFDCVDFNLADTDTVYYTAPEAQAIALLQAEVAHIHAAGMTVSQIHGPWRWPPQDGTLAQFFERQDKMRRSLRLAAAVGCPLWVVHPVMPFGIEELGTPRADDTWMVNLAFFTPLVEEAKALGVTICLENMPMPQFSLGTPQETLRLARALGVKLCLDTGHVAVYGGALDLAQAVRDAGDDLKALHLHDNDGVRDTHRLPFMGICNWKRFAAALKEIGFDGTLSAETEPPALLPPPAWEAVSRAIAQMLLHLQTLAN